MDYKAANREQDLKKLTDLFGRISFAIHFSDSSAQSKVNDAMPSARYAEKASGINLAGEYLQTIGSQEWERKFRECAEHLHIPLEDKLTLRTSVRHTLGMRHGIPLVDELVFQYKEGLLTFQEYIRSVADVLSRTIRELPTVEICD